MDDEIYKMPDANLVDPDDQAPPLVNPLFVALLLIGTGVAMGLVLTVVEYVSGLSLSGATSATPVVTAYLVGYYYGSRRGCLFPARYRASVIAYWVFISIGSAGIIIYLGVPETMNVGYVGKNAAIYAIVVLVATVLVSLLSYFIFRTGEKAGIKNWQKMHTTGAWILKKEN